MAGTSPAMTWFDYIAYDSRRSSNRYPALFGAATTSDPEVERRETLCIVMSDR
jgi:hypothetical protein